MVAPEFSFGVFSFITLVAKGLPAVMLVFPVSFLLIAVGLRLLRRS
jgi:hypothetical protein